jgi:hypothetical protein
LQCAQIIGNVSRQFLDGTPIHFLHDASSLRGITAVLAVPVASFVVSNLEPLVVVMVVFSADDDEEAFAVVVVGRAGDFDICSGLVIEAFSFLVFPMMSLMFGVVVRTANMSVKFCEVRRVYSWEIDEHTPRYALKSCYTLR